MSKFNPCLRNGFVSFGDDFDVVAEVTHLFGVNASKLPYHNWFKVPGKTDVITWLPSRYGGRGWHNVPEYGPHNDTHGWEEILTISEYNDDTETNSKRIDDELAKPRTRYVFWRQEREGAQWYKFYGTFLIDADATRATLASEHPHVVYRRYSETAECLKVEDVRSEPLSDADFAALKGRMLQVKFLDEIGFSADCGKIVEGSVRVWPGMKLFVTEVDPNHVHAICDTQNGNLIESVRKHIQVGNRGDFQKVICFTVPRTDFDLGYVEVLPGAGSLGDTFAEKEDDSEDRARFCGSASYGSGCYHSPTGKHESEKKHEF